MRALRSAWVLSVLIAALGAGCGSDGNTPASSADGGGVLPGTASLGVTVKLPDGASGTAVAGANVALAMEGGGKVELSTGADGRAVFSGFAWSAGPAAVTAHLTGFPLVSRVGIREADGNVVLWIPESDPSDFRDRTEFMAPEDTVVLSGLAQNMTDESNQLLLTSAYSSWQDVGPTWSLRVPRGLPVVLVGAEFHATQSGQDFLGWVAVEHPGASADATVVVDFATRMTSKHVSGTFRAPAAPSGSRDWLAYVVVRAYCEVGGVPLAAPYIGFATRIPTAPTDGAYDYRVEYVEPSGSADVLTQYEILYTPATGTQNRRSASTYVLRHGYPSAGSQDFTFLRPPVMITPRTPGKSVHAPMSWELREPGVEVTLSLYRGPFHANSWRGPGGPLFWVVHAPLDSTGLTVPQPPSSADVASVGGLNGELRISQNHPGCLHDDRRAIATIQGLFPW